MSDIGFVNGGREPNGLKSNRNVPFNVSRNDLLKIENELLQAKNLKLQTAMRNLQCDLQNKIDEYKTLKQNHDSYPNVSSIIDSIEEIITRSQQISIHDLKVKDMQQSTKRRRPEALKDNDNDDLTTTLISEVNLDVKNLDQSHFMLTDEGSSDNPDLGKDFSEVLPLELVEEIVDYLDLSDLKTLREVNVAWNEISSRRLQKRDICTISFRHDSKRNAFIHLSKKKCPSLVCGWKPSVTDFIECLRQTRHKFPSSHLLIEGGDLTSPDLKPLFILLGFRIETLHVSWTPKGTNMCDFLEIVSRYFPNLKNLMVDNIGCIEHITPPDTNLTLPLLPSIKTFKLVDDDSVCDNPGFVYVVLKCATNLEIFEPRLEDEDMMYVEYFIGFNKMHTFRSCVFRPTDQFIHYYEMCASSMTSLKQLTLLGTFLRRHGDLQVQKRALATLVQILRANRESLETLEVSDPLSYLLPYWQPWPEMTGVKTLLIDLDQYFEDVYVDDDHPKDDFYMFPSCLHLDQCFPFLHTVNLTGFDEDDFLTEYNDSYPFMESMTMVKRLVLSFAIPLSWFEKLSLTFPNCQRLSISDIKAFPACGASFWKFNEVTSLTLSFCIEDQFPLNSFPAIDATFTGFSNATCHGLDLGGFILDAGQYKENPSILELTKLRDLKIVLIDDEDETKESYKVFTTATAKYALQLMTQVHIFVQGSAKEQNAEKMKEYLDWIRPYAQDVRFELITEAEETNW